ncbi:MAG: Zn-dependent exopeptidase M28 [Clostridiales bacterium]|nr:Zn-dependent exopeptidase M28 [Clostridiales bacterium]
MSIIETLLEQHPIRKNKAQKQAFREWFIEEAARMGYTAQVHTKGSSNNLVVGDPESAKAVYTAHYDTPAVMPLPNFITPKNLLVYILYQMLIVVVFIAVCFGSGVLVGWLTKEPLWGSSVSMVAYFALLFLMLAGPANKNCANDNTSGVAAVMEIMARLPEAERGKVAFILFDNEEKGMLGSSAYASTHKDFKKNGLVINLDCVGDGEHMFFFANKKTRALPAYALLEEAMGSQQGCTLHMDKMEKAIYPSDQACFKLGIAVCACNKMKVVGYYVDKIHTKKDTVCEQVNLDFLANGLVDFASRL